MGLAGRPRPQTARGHVVAVDYGAKRNILRSLASAGCRVTVVPATATAEDILRHDPDGVFRSNGPATRRRPAHTPCRRSRACSPRASRCSASASATSCWRWRSARKPTSSTAAIAAPTSRSRNCHRARRDHQPEPRLRGRRGKPAGGRAGHPCQPVRRQQRGHRLRRPAGVPVQYRRGEPGADRQLFPAVRRRWSGRVEMSYTKPPSMNSLRSPTPPKGEGDNAPDFPLRLVGGHRSIPCRTIRPIGRHRNNRGAHQRRRGLPAVRDSAGTNARSPPSFQPPSPKRLAAGLHPRTRRACPGGLQCHWRLELTPGRGRRAARDHRSLTCPSAPTSSPS